MPFLLIVPCYTQGQWSGLGVEACTVTVTHLLLRIMIGYYNYFNTLSLVSLKITGRQCLALQFSDTFYNSP